jgi:hypothetical protein
MYRDSDVRQTEIHAGEQLIPEVEISIGNSRRYKSPGIDQILAELIQAGGKILRSEVHKLIHSTSILNKEEFPD